MYTVFFDFKSIDYYIVSNNSIDYADHKLLEEAGSLAIVKEGRKRECQDYVDDMMGEMVS